MDNKNKTTAAGYQEGTAQQNNIVAVMSNPLTDLFLEAAPNIGDLKTYEERKGLVSKGSHKVQVKNDGKNPIEILKEKADKYTAGIKILNSKKLKTAGKLYTFILMKAGEQCFKNGKMVTNEIHLDLPGMVKAGIYTSNRAAREGYEHNKPKLKAVEIGITVKTKQGNKSFNFKGSGPMFSWFSEINDAKMVVNLNRDVPWESVLDFFKSYMYVPESILSLPINPFYMALCIFYFARQNGKSIKEHGGFFIKNRTYQSRMGLPKEGKIKNPGRDIKEVINTSVDILNTFFSKDKQPICSLEKRDIDTESIKDYLDTGGTWVTISGELKDKILQTEAKKTKAIDDNTKRLEKAREGALIKAITSKLKDSKTIEKAIADTLNEEGGGSIEEN